MYSQIITKDSTKLVKDIANESDQTYDLRMKKILIFNWKFSK